MKSDQADGLILLPLGTVPEEIFRHLPSPAPAIPLPLRYLDEDGSLRADWILEDPAWLGELRAKDGDDGNGDDGNEDPRPHVLVTTHPLSTRECSRLLGLSSQRRQMAVVSVQGLGTPAAPRLRNLILHELGHLQGLAHCSTPGCLMNPVRNPEEIDLRQDIPCGMGHAP